MRKQNAASSRELLVQNFSRTSARPDSSAVGANSVFMKRFQRIVHRRMNLQHRVKPSQVEQSAYQMVGPGDFEVHIFFLRPGVQKRSLPMPALSRELTPLRSRTILRACDITSPTTRESAAASSR